jgi:hypothetical protein
MFIGHFAPALAAATHKDAPSLPVLFIGAQLVDWAFFGLLLTGAEKMRVSPGISVMNPMDLYHMPYTHSLIGSAVFGLLFAALIWMVSRNRTAALIGFGVVVSHWLLDLLVHVPDLTITGQPPKLGLGLWNHPMIEMPLEIAITMGALWLYARATGGLRLSIAVLAGILLILQAINWFGPVATVVDANTTWLAWFAYGLATLAAWWAAKPVSARPSGTV